MFKRLFCRLYHGWLKHAVNDKSDPLVIVLDFLFGSNCKYCMATRAVCFGIGLGLFLGSNFFGIVLMVVAGLATLGERYWLCEVE